MDGRCPVPRRPRSGAAQPAPSSTRSWSSSSSRRWSRPQPLARLCKGDAMEGAETGGEPITAAGMTALREEIEQLEGEGRTKMAARIKVAREEGDLKENAEYHIAKEDQA